VIRTAIVADVGGVVDMVHGELAGLSLERSLELVADSIGQGGCLVHEDVDGVLDGAVLFESRHFFGRDFVKLLVVRRSARRRGIGGQLLEAVIGGGTSGKVFISTNESNAPMRALLARERWTFSGTLTGLDEGDPELVFWRDASLRTGE
jgi:GNAT superfamily N-acetyltransferase